MQVQMLSFDLGKPGQGWSPRYVSTLELAVKEMPGVTSARFVAGSRTFANIVWEDAASIERFRRSELYARLMLGPHVEAAEDRCFGAGAPSVTAIRGAFQEAA